MPSPHLKPASVSSSSLETYALYQASAFQRGGRWRAQKPNCAGASEVIESLNAEKPKAAKTLKGNVSRWFGLGNQRDGVRVSHKGEPRSGQFSEADTLPGPGRGLVVD